MGLAALPPGGQVGCPIGDTPFPLGTILVVQRSPEDVTALPEVLAARHRSPWAPVAWLTSSPDHPLFRDQVWRTLAGGQVLPVAPANGDIAGQARLALRQRPGVSVEEMVGFCRVRLSGAKAALIEAALEGPASRSLRRHLAKHGLPAASVWQRGYEAARCVTEAMRTGRSRSAVALERRIPERTLGTCCRLLLGASWRELVAMPGWEPIIELMLRNHRVVSPE